MFLDDGLLQSGLCASQEEGKKGVNMVRGMKQEMNGRINKGFAMPYRANFVKRKYVRMNDGLLFIIILDEKD